MDLRPALMADQKKSDKFNMTINCMKFAMPFMLFLGISKTAIAFDKIFCESNLKDSSIYTWSSKSKKEMIVLNSKISSLYLDEKDSQILDYRDEFGESLLKISPWGGISALTDSKDSTVNLTSDNETWFRLIYSPKLSNATEEINCKLTF